MVTTALDRPHIDTIHGCSICAFVIETEDIYTPLKQFVSGKCERCNTPMVAFWSHETMLEIPPKTLSHMLHEYQQLGGTDATPFDNSHYSLHSHGVK